MSSSRNTHFTEQSSDSILQLPIVKYLIVLCFFFCNFCKQTKSTHKISYSTVCPIPFFNEQSKNHKLKPLEQVSQSWSRCPSFTEVSSAWFPWVPQYKIGQTVEHGVLCLFIVCFYNLQVCGHWLKASQRWFHTIRITNIRMQISQ